MKIRLTNNSELDLDTVETVFAFGTSYRIVFKDGGAKTVRAATLTREGMNTLHQLAVARLDSEAARRPDAGEGAYGSQG